MKQALIYGFIFMLGCVTARSVPSPLLDEAYAGSSKIASYCTAARDMPDVDGDYVDRLNAYSKKMAKKGYRLLTVSAGYGVTLVCYAKG